jgi:4-amino-4-deoxy-L-arabinose transferase-like glycosyltransferase
VVVVFFSASRSKLPGYILPAVPALLLVFARHFSTLSERLRFSPAFACIAVGGALALLAATLPVLGERYAWKSFEPEYSVWLFGAALVLWGAGVFALALQERALREPAFASVALGSLLAAQIALSGTHVADEHYSSERLIEPLAGDSLRFPRDPPFYSVGGYDQSVPFYLGRAITLVAHKDELAPGIDAEPSKYIGTIDEFLGRWREDAEAFAIMAPKLYEKLSAEGLPGRVIARDARWVIVSRR